MARGRPALFCEAVKMMLAVCLCVSMSSITAPAWSQTVKGAACRSATTPDEKALVERSRELLANLDRTRSLLTRQTAELEQKLRSPDASGESLDAYRQTRLLIQNVEAQRAELQQMLAAWCPEAEPADK